MLVVESIVIYHFVVKRIRIKKILRPKYIIGILFVYLFLRHIQNLGKRERICNS